MSNQATLEPTVTKAKPAVLEKRPRKTVTSGPGHVFNKFVTNVRLKAQETRHVLIGSSASPVPPKGFSIELKPQKMPAGTLVTHITTEGTVKRYDYVLDITNCSDRPVSAQVWQM